MGPHRAIYWFAVLMLLGGLVALRFWLGVAAFSLLAWVYNIAHFVKAETFFSGTHETRSSFYSPVAAFAWFTVCLFQVGPLTNLLIVVVGSMVPAAIFLVAGAWRQLASGNVRLPLLTLFVLGETMVWAGYGPSESFRVGLYIFHIAAAGFYHYLTSYFFAESGSARQRDRFLSPAWILLVNAGILALCCAVAWLPRLHWLTPVLGVQWFTLWVALHLAASDLQPWWRQHLARVNAATRQNSIA